MKDTGKTYASLPKLTCDIRAEVVVADLIERGFNATDIVVFPHGSFRRRYKKDISHIEEVKLSSSRTGIGVHLNRDGIYDALPEALFHDLPSESSRGVSEMARNSKKQKQREKESRTFFLPIENELFFQRVLLELAERKVIQRLSENVFQDVFPGFWNIDRDLPKELVSRLMLFLQYSYKFVGNLELTAQILSLILNEPVSVQWKTHKPKFTGNNGTTGKTSGLGNASLGVDFIAGSAIGAELPCVEFFIGPLENSDTADYLSNGKRDRFLDVFFGFFIPLEITVIRNILAPAAINEFVLSDETPSFLGYNTALQPL